MNYLRHIVFGIAGVLFFVPHVCFTGSVEGERVASVISLNMPMNVIEKDFTTTSTLLAMHRRGGHSRRHVAARRANPNRVYRARPGRSRAAYRHGRSGYRHHRPWRNYWRPYYWGPWPWWGYGYVFPFGCRFYPGWGWWYYPPYGCSYYAHWGCWYFDRWGYWYYPGLQFGAYIASRPDRIVYVDNDSDDDLYYAVYYRRRIGDVYYLSRVDEPMFIEGRRAVKVRLPKGKSSDYMVVAEKTEDKLPRRMHQDRTGKVVDPGKEDSGHRPSEVESVTREKINVEELSKKDKRELKKMKRKLREKDKKLRELSREIAKIKNPAAEAKEKELQRIDAVRERQAPSNANGNAEQRIAVDAD